jgi:hypothetical protein
MATEIHKDDIGTRFQVTIMDGSSVVDVSTATTKQIILRKPDETNLTKDASFYTDGTDGIITYTTTEGDLDVAGVWQIQAYIIIGSNKWHTDIGTFRVYPNL